ncbi:hypothetical protein FDA94_29025 [Herbidospora galbida]|uniref:PD-(D/E)XK endonuclease-like domain-containing protein n=1 Tax=Herbidospora galbida TaxID=2575442 RepID=A0A4U3M8S2_9ACTN|nr:hypothetical protein [Herbidospora galbida]TKK84659.1 hypothetical protein FDA94_29025 [Herbidospora galbida]
MANVKLTGSLAEIAAATKQPTVLLGTIVGHVQHKASLPDDRRQDIIHPSEMAHDDWCPRQTYYRIDAVRRGETIPPEVHSWVTENIFAEGHSIHSKWQGWLAELGLLSGHWRCLVCKCIVTTEVGPEPHWCPFCETRTFEYAELPLSAEDSHLIAGHTDGFVPSKHCLIEIKSIGLGTIRIDAPSLVRKYTAERPDGKKIPDLDEIWRQLEAPLPSHVKQGAIYLWMAQQLGYEVSRIVFLYEFKANQQTKEFSLRLDKATRLILDDLLNKATQIFNAIHHDAPPPDRAHVFTSKACTSCHFLSTCWPEPDANPAPQVTDLQAHPQDGTRRLRRRDRQPAAPERDRPT